ncbi:hypothetical protein [Streptomyces sviceus]|uniref:hypothetical protein n=1 Tax=Streptomyces sviceus TaxID=285530 RepID=UPI0036F11DAE
MPEPQTGQGDHVVAQGAALAAGANVSASDIGNALGAWAGGLAITVGLGCTAPLRQHRASSLRR